MDEQERRAERAPENGGREPPPNRKPGTDDMRPTLNVLSSEMIRRILDEAMRIMAEDGMEIRGPGMRQRLLTLAAREQLQHMQRLDGSMRGHGEIACHREWVDQELR